MKCAHLLLHLQLLYRRSSTMDFFSVTNSLSFTAELVHVWFLACVWQRTHLTGDSTQELWGEPIAALRVSVLHVCTVMIQCINTEKHTTLLNHSNGVHGNTPEITIDTCFIYHPARGKPRHLSGAFLSSPSPKPLTKSYWIHFYIGFFTSSLDHLASLFQVFWPLAYLLPNYT